MKDKKTYDLTLGNWGPYNKEYLGICHISNPEIGQTFNVELFPGIFRRSILACPSVNDSGVKMWQANPQLTHFVYRYELEWKDKLYVDAHFNITDDKVVNVDCQVVNNTDFNRGVNLNFCASIKYPYMKQGTLFKEYYKRCKADVPNDCIYINALDYEDISCDMVMAQDGKYLGEAMGNCCTDGYTYLEGKFFAKNSHYAQYFVKRELSSIGIRYKCDENTILKVFVDGKSYDINLHKADDFSYEVIKIEKDYAEKIRIIPTGDPVSIDCIIVGNDADKATFGIDENIFEPVLKEVKDNSVILRYAHSEYEYEIQWKNPMQMVRTLYTDDAGRLLEKKIHNHVSTELYDTLPYETVYENLLSEPLYLKPHSKGKISFVIKSRKINEENLVDKKETGKLYEIKPNRDGETYAFSQNIMSSTTLLNVVYPIYTRRGFIRHNTPGRNWDSLYSWDSGFIGLGLSVIDFQRAYDCLNTYLTPVGDKHSPYIFHGSVVPIQIFLYEELINKFPEYRDKLKSLYPMVQQYYDFYSGIHKNTDNIKSDLLKTWHIFYNSGGWDDYPPQKALRYNLDIYNKGAEYKNTTPVITTAVTVLIASIMKNISILLGFEENIHQYDSDIQKYSQAIQKYLWDDESGYYSYMVHDDKGEPKEFLRYIDGTNYNCGFDGIYPYIAGISDKYQSKRIKENILKGLFTKAGVGVVDKRAPYYTPYGYWNGSVWMPHQWILYKSLLDKGEISLAFKIASTALNVWKDEVDDSYSCFEHFMSSNCRGAGFHQFSGLSCPVLKFFEAFYIPGNIDTGFGTIIKNVRWNRTKTKATICTVSDSPCANIVICMKDGFDYRFEIDGKTVKAKKITSGAYAVEIGKGEKHINVMCIN